MELHLAPRLGNSEINKRWLSRVCHYWLAAHRVTNPIFADNSIFFFFFFLMSGRWARIMNWSWAHHTGQEPCAMSCTDLGYTRLHRTPRVAQNSPSPGLGSIYQGTEGDLETGMLHRCLAKMLILSPTAQSRRKKLQIPKSLCERCYCSGNSTAFISTH